MNFARYHQKGFYLGYGIGALNTHIKIYIRYFSDKLNLTKNQDQLMGIFYRVKAALVMISERDPFHKINMATDFSRYQVKYMTERYEEIVLEKILKDGLSWEDAAEFLDLKYFDIFLIHGRLQKLNDEEDSKRVLILLEKEENHEASKVDVSWYLNR